MREVINQLKNTEEAADETIRSTEKKAAEIIAKAKADGEMLFAEKKKKAEILAAEIIADAEKNAIGLYERIAEGYDGRCSELHMLTKNSEDIAVQNIVKNLT